MGRILKIHRVGFTRSYLRASFWAANVATLGVVGLLLALAGIAAWYVFLT